MSQKSSGLPTRVPAKKLVRDISGAVHEHHSAEHKILIVLKGPRDVESVVAFCRRKVTAASPEKLSPNKISWRL
jgi:transposase